MIFMSLKWRPFLRLLIFDALSNAIWESRKTTRTEHLFPSFIVMRVADARQRMRLAKHLAPLNRLGLIQDWYDNDITPGDEWVEEIAVKLKTADIVLLLISADFVNSKYCYETELVEAMKKHEEGTAVVIPIIVRATNAWAKLPFGKLNVLPAQGKPIAKWATHDDGWANVAYGVERAAEKLKERRSAGYLRSE
jgi:hypothetical protein